jgi:uncharacterized protein
MFVAWARYELHLPDARSLKDKRAIVRSLLDGLHTRMRIATAEVDHLDLHQRAALGVSIVSNESGHARSLLDQVSRRIETAPGVDVLSIKSGLVGEDDE